MSIGMSYDEFWRDSPEIAKYYRKAAQLRADKENYVAWLQGLYIYEALCDVSPIFNPYAKSGTRPHPYPSKPHKDESKKTKKEVETEEKQKMEKLRKIMDAYATRVNKKHEEVSKDGR